MKNNIDYKSKGFKKKWTDNKDGFWWEKYFKTRLGKVTLYVDEDYPGRELGIAIGSFEFIKEDKLKNLDSWIEYLNSI